MASWEYIGVAVEGSRPEYDEGRGPLETRAEAAEKWYDLLNARGAEGWELVSERYAVGGDSGRGYWATFGGTMKRATPDDPR